MGVGSRNIKPIAIVALNTGMRKSEILNLKWNDIDFKRGIIYLLRTKNNEKREIPMNDAVITVLIKVKKNPESQYIFCGKNGKPLQNIRKSFFTALKNAGIINFRFHDLRHTFASQLGDGLINSVDDACHCNLILSVIELMPWPILKVLAGLKPNGFALTNHG